MRDEANIDTSVSVQTDFKETAVRLVLTREVSRAHLASDLGVGLPTLSRWVRDAIEQTPYGDVLKSLHDEVGMLRKENVALRKMLLGRDVGAASDAIGAEGAD